MWWFHKSKKLLNQYQFEHQVWTFTGVMCMKLAFWPFPKFMLIMLCAIFLYNLSIGCDFTVWRTKSFLNSNIPRGTCLRFKLYYASFVLKSFLFVSASEQGLYRSICVNVFPLGSLFAFISIVSVPGNFFLIIFHVYVTIWCHWYIHFTFFL